MTKVNVYEIVSEHVVKMLEEGMVPWRKTWDSGSAPRNIEGHKYRGINVFILAAQGYESPFWLTFKQAKERGGHVKKGEKSTLIVYWNILRKKERDEVTGELVNKTIPLLRYYRVFNLTQTEGVKVPKKVAEWDAKAEAVESNLDADAIIAGYENGPEVRFMGDQPLYRPTMDVIEVPRKQDFESADEFYTTLFHEMGHSTGHKSRLNRHLEDNGGFGSHAYGREELVAEMTAAFLSGEAGIESTLENNAAYLASWIKVIKEDEKAVVWAAGHAQKASDLILGRKFEQEESEEDKEKEAVAA